jgi:aspartyl-tRNA(Asn)/glutamyl-tRNA(Gln) amidotransferase subunit B
VDANISIQPKGWFEREGKGKEDRGRAEVKNISSYKGVEKALTFEVTRQKNSLRRGQKLESATRHFVEARGVTTASRSKEMEQEYRYFPEPDLRPLRVRDWAAGIVLPELPDARKVRFMENYGFSPTHAATVTGDWKVAEFYDNLPIDLRTQGATATWVADTLIGELNYRDIDILKLPSDHFCEILNDVKGGNITEKTGVEVLRHILDQIKETGKCESPSQYIEREGLKVISLKGSIDECSEVSASLTIEEIIEKNPIVLAVREVISEQPQAVADFHAGKREAFNFLVGQVMKKTRGRAKPADVHQVLSGILGEEG